jgi:hypothetical protein
MGVRGIGAIPVKRTATEPQFKIVESGQITEAIAPHGHFAVKSYVRARLHAVRPPILKALPVA